jgi:hypothetical protein
VNGIVAIRIQSQSSAKARLALEKLFGRSADVSDEASVDVIVLLQHFVERKPFALLCLERVERIDPSVLHGVSRRPATSLHNW